MDVLKKIKSATLMEALIATILIVVIFIVSSLVINNLLLNAFNNKTDEIENRLSQLEYEYQNHKIQLPYNESFEKWNVSVIKGQQISNEFPVLIFMAQKNQSQKTIIKKRIDE